MQRIRLTFVSLLLLISLASCSLPGPPPDNPPPHIPPTASPRSQAVLKTNTAATTVAFEQLFLHYRRPV